MSTIARWNCAAAAGSVREVVEAIVAAVAAPVADAAAHALVELGPALPDHAAGQQRPSAQRLRVVFAQQLAQRGVSV